jgi:hypothetical protein
MADGYKRDTSRGLLAVLKFESVLKPHGIEKFVQPFVSDALSGIRPSDGGSLKTG